MADLEIVKGLLNFGSFGLIAWLFFHTFTRLVPTLHERFDKIVDRFEASLRRQHTECNDMLSAQREKFEEMLAATNATHERAWTELADAIRENTAAAASAFASMRNAPAAANFANGATAPDSLPPHAHPAKEHS